MRKERGGAVSEYQPKIVLLDIETVPHEVLCWGNKWEPKVIQYNKYSSILSFGWKVLGEKTKVIATWDFNSNPRDDSKLCKEIKKILDSADIVVAHNGRAFDLRTINSRFAHNQVKPPSFDKQIDTLLMARNCFQFPSNSLDDLANYLGVGRKIAHKGKDLWLGCLAGNGKDQAMMKKYNAHDCDLLERVYLRLRPFANNHPRLDYYTRKEECPTCQSKHIVRDGFSYVASGKRQLMECQDCGKHWKVGKIIK